MDVLRRRPRLDEPVGRLHEAVLGDPRVRRQRADEADVRTLGRLDRAHAAVMRLVDVAHLDRCALAGQAAGAERSQAAAMREAGQRVRLVHELRQLRGAEELLQRRHDRPDVDDRLRRDRVDVLGRHPLADDALHAVQADAERLLDELADRAQAPVAEVLVLVDLAAHLFRPRDAHGLLGVVLRVLGHAELDRQRDEAADELGEVGRWSGRGRRGRRSGRGASSACSGRRGSGRTAWGRRRARAGGPSSSRASAARPGAAS